MKFLNNSANAKELDFLNDCIQQNENEPVFKDYIKTKLVITYGMNNPNSSEIKDRLLKEIQKDKSTVRRLRVKSVLKYAAIFLLIFGLGFYVKKDNKTEITNSKVVPKVEDITLELENGNVLVITENGSSTVIDKQGNVVGAQNGNTLVYDDTQNQEVLIYNTLRVPKGKRFEIKLSDDTMVFLNSGSSLKYPVRFIKGQERKVYLNGEAFFDVEKDTAHPFVVNAQEVDIQVLGTEFNVSTYPEDINIDVVLVEGSVQLAQENMGQETNTFALEPGFNASFSKKEKVFSKKKVNTSLYTSWMSGQTRFRKVSFEEITKKLERLYNVVIVLNNKKLANEKFNATINVDKQNIEDVLESFNTLYEIDFTILNNEIIIN